MRPVRRRIRRRHSIELLGGRNTPKGEWSEAYQTELQGMDSKAWSREGQRIAEAIQNELGPTAEVGYRPN